MLLITIILGALTIVNLTVLACSLYLNRKIDRITPTFLNLQQLEREETQKYWNNFQDLLYRQLTANSTSQKEQLDSFAKLLSQLTQLNENKLENMRATIESRLSMLQNDNNSKLEQMRATVEEKLHNTLENRLGQSFKIVSERLEQVHKGLGEMQSLATGVGDLKKVLTNVKTRGIWGEVQLEAIIEQLLTSEQYLTNVSVKPNDSNRVECAIKLPGKGEDGESVLLPIDAKFPMEDYQRLVEAQEMGDIALVQESSRLLEISLKKSAKTISEKYISPPHTTDFAIMFLPVEALYAEALRIPSLIEVLQRDYRVIITSPTTLSAILNSLQMGFRTLAIQKRSSEVWQTLGIIKAEFSKFSEILSKTKLKLEQAQKVIGQAETKTRTIQRKLSKVEALPDT
jgi:DNA recombination protein RmuC